MTETLEVIVDKFTFKVAVDRFYTTEGVWVLVNGNNVRIGLSDYLQQRSGDIAFVEVKPEGTVLAPGNEVALVETIKVTVNLGSPVAGNVARVNPILPRAPESINQDPYGEGWLCDIEASDWDSDRKALLDCTGYFAQVKHDAEGEA